jgi:hypothetical protein
MAPARTSVISIVPHPVVVVLSLLLAVTLLVCALWTGEAAVVPATLAALACIGFAPDAARARGRRFSASASARGPPPR